MEITCYFYCENNGYAMGTSVERTANHYRYLEIRFRIRNALWTRRCNEPHKVAEAIDEAIERARRGDGPTFLEMKTYRYRGHSMSDAQHYRTKDEVEEYKKIDPITQVIDVILEKNYATVEEIAAIDKECKGKGERM